MIRLRVLLTGLAVHVSLAGTLLGVGGPVASGTESGGSEGLTLIDAMSLSEEPVFEEVTLLATPTPSPVVTPGTALANIDLFTVNQNPANSPGPSQRSVDLERFILHNGESVWFDQNSSSAVDLSNLAVPSNHEWDVYRTVVGTESYQTVLSDGVDTQVYGLGGLGK